MTKDFYCNHKSIFFGSSFFLLTASYTQMENYEIADKFKLLSQLMELHNENSFKIRSYQNASFKIDKMNDVKLMECDLPTLEQMDGIGKSVASKILELQQTGTINEIEKLQAVTPQGVLHMMKIKGIGPKKVAVLWKELEVETLGELLYACNENRLIELKGFGDKTQTQIKKALEFTISNAGKFHYAALEKTAMTLVDTLKNSGFCSQASLTGAIRRKCEILDCIEVIVATDNVEKLISFLQSAGIAHKTERNNNALIFTIAENIKSILYLANDDDFVWQLFYTTASIAHKEQLETIITGEQMAGKKYLSEKEIYLVYNLSYIEPEMREGLEEIKLARQNALPHLVSLANLKGILHNHSTYSDGIHTLEQMATNCRDLGYTYFGICDHSKSAFYANGMQPDRVLQQQKEIDLLNKKLAPFHIFKGIESDILSDGNLDYDDEILKTFDFVVASVHSNLKMDEDKATARLLRAIENPYTRILGHPTGRLLLAREGYPIDHKKIIDACAANNVAIELNAHPYRLDLDWRHIAYAVSKCVMISINPDAHSKDGFHDMYYGVCVARKGGLQAEQTLNALDVIAIEKFFKRL